MNRASRIALLALTPGAIFLTFSILLAQPGGERERVHVYSKARGSDLEYYAENRSLLPMQLEVGFGRTEGLYPSRDLPLYVILEPGEKETFLFSLKSPKGQVKAGYRYWPGNPRKTVHDDTVLYQFPFEHGTKFSLDQGYNGVNTHAPPHNFSLDFRMPEGTRVYAARDGLVVRSKGDSRRGGPSRQYLRDGNIVEIFHKDGSVAKYAHLRYGGALARVGDRVRAGQHIGYSGNTGFSNGPHLHFEVNIPIHKGIKSIPTRFLGRDGRAVTPVEGRYYFAYHRGRPDFDEVYGANLTNADFASHAVKINLENRIDVRQDRSDDTIILFFQNGFSTPREFTIKLNLVNLRASRPMPVVLRVPASTEVFLTLLRPIDLRRPFSFHADDVIMRPLPAATGGAQ